MIERPQGEEPIILDHTDDTILISKFCKKWHNPKHAFYSYFELYIYHWFEQEHIHPDAYIKGKYWIYDRDKSHIFYKWNITNKDGKKWTYDLAIAYDNFLNFIINLENQEKINEILFNREQENLKPKIQQRSLF